MTYRAFSSRAGGRARVVGRQSAHLTGLVVAALAAAPAMAQRRKPEKVDAFKDPYTKNDAATMQALGYVAMGQFLWVGDVTTAQVQQILGDDIAVFIETAHFKLASTLRSFPWPKEKDWRDALQAEIDTLAAHCPALKTRPKAIDPWLRAHLYAHRLEALYGDFCTRLGIDPQAFPATAGGKRNAAYMGEGPNLGQPGKFLVLLTHKELSAGTYTRAVQGHAANDTTRHNHVKEGSLATVIAAEFAEKALLDDRNLHCHVVYSVTHNLIDGYKYYWQSVPAWLSEGLSLWFSRKVREEFLNFSGSDDAGANTLKGWEWERRVRMRVDNDVWPKAENLCTVTDPSTLDFVAHMMVWSRVDFLVQKHGEGFGRFLGRMKAPIGEEARQPAAAEVLQRQVEALRSELALDFAEFDKEWLEFVRATYGRK